MAKHRPRWMSRYSRSTKERLIANGRRGDRLVKRKKAKKKIIGVVIDDSKTTKSYCYSNTDKKIRHKSKRPVKRYLHSKAIDVLSTTQGAATTLTKKTCLILGSLESKDHRLRPSQRCDNIKECTQSR